MNQSSNPRRALITGITGQDGSYLAEFLLGKGYDVHGIIRRSSSFNTGRLDHIYQDPHVTGSRLHLHYGDLTDAAGLRDVLSKTRPTEVYNLGALCVVDVKREANAILEARKLGIPVIGLIDTDSDPDMVDIAIPGNDDAMRAIDLVMKELSAAVIEGKAGRVAKEEQDKLQHQNRPERSDRRRRPTSSQSAEDFNAPSDEKPAPQPEPARPVAPVLGSPTGQIPLTSATPTA